jgi:hypothetical protein
MTFNYKYYLVYNVFVIRKFTGILLGEDDIVLFYVMCYRELKKNEKIIEKVIMLGFTFKY